MKIRDKRLWCKLGSRLPRAVAVRGVGLHLWAVVLLVLLTADLMGQEATVAAQRASLDSLRDAIVAKNIFRPARVPASALYPVYDSPTEDIAPDLLPARLNRSFSLIGFTTTNEGSFANIRLDNPSENRRVRVGDSIEFVRVLEVSPPYIRCDYEGRIVRIDVGESSDDAYSRLLGLGNDYVLLGTTVTPKGSSARFYFLAEDKELTVEVGDLLGNAQVISIIHGQVLLREPDGNEIIIR
ncbi:MAG: hypothetical protein JW936_10045 [Sedimentisphaerales bacterium]|nr:hypothetical protein [Sedimentisphaerales bacterium]